MIPVFKEDTRNITFFSLNILSSEYFGLIYADLPLKHSITNNANGKK